MTDRPEFRQEALAIELVRQAAHKGIITYADIEPLLPRLLPRSTDAGQTPFELYCLLLENGEEQALTLAQRIHSAILKEAVRVAQLRRINPVYTWDLVQALAHLPQEFPVPVKNLDQALPILRRAAVLDRDRAFLAASAPDLKAPLQTLAAECAKQRELLLNQSVVWSLLSPSELWAGFVPPQGTTLPPSATIDSREENERQLAELVERALSPSEAATLDALKQLLSWPTDAFTPFIIQACVTPKARAYAMHALALRTGAQYTNWWEWENWLKRTKEADDRLYSAATGLVEEFRDELRLLWLSTQAGTVDPALEIALTVAITRRATQCVSPAEFVRRWDHALTPSDVDRLVGAAEFSHVAQNLPPPLPVSAEQTERKEIPELKAPEETLENRQIVVEEPEPSVWEEHIRPFLAANWYIIAGLLMVVAGSSLLAYFTWDKSVLVRYLFLPLMLAGFTAGMAELGLRLSRRHADLRATGTFLLGGAVCLLPVNFIVLCRAGEDPGASHLLLPALGLYTAMAGLGLWRWCCAVGKELRTMLGLPLLAVNLLAVLGDMPGVREAAAGHRALLVPATITAAVLLLLGISNRFLRLVLTKELLEAKLVPWFFGITMAATTVQVSVWRHFHLHLTPRPQDYALAAILAGAALLRWERRACELRNTGASYGGESFLGYAALLLGILMAAGNEWLRIVALLLVGFIWLVQAQRRPGVVHHWIGFTLCLLGGAACGLLEVFPKNGELNLLPELGLSLALIAGLVRALAGRFGDTRLRQVALEIQPPILLLSAIVAVLSQYDLHSAPWQTGLVLLATVVFFAFRASRENRQDWLHVAAAGAGLTLPYLGFADMARYRFDENTLALGYGSLAAVWLLAARFLKVEIWRRSGAFVAACFGGAGILGLCLRLMLACSAALGSAELAGGALLAVVLGIVSWQMRSQVPGLMAVGLLAVVLPLFQIPANVVPEWLYVGSGLTSAAVAFMLVLGGFELRRRGVATSAAWETDKDAKGRVTVAIFITPVFAAMFWLAGKALLLQFQPHFIQTQFIGSAFLLAATSYAAAIYFREKLLGKFLLRVSWPLLGAGIAMACESAGCRNLEMFQYPLLCAGVAFTVVLAAEQAVARKFEWATTFLVRPRLRLLAYGSAVVAILTVLAVQLPARDCRNDLQWLTLFCTIQLVWHVLRSSKRYFGAVLFVLAISWLSSWRNWPESFASVPVFLLAVFVADVVLEFFAKTRAFLKPLREPFVALGTGLATALVLVVLFSVHRAAEGAITFIQPQTELWVLLLTLLLVARAQACASYALLAVAFGYTYWLLPCRGNELIRPWRLADLALAMCFLPFLGRFLSARLPRLLRGPSPQSPATAALPQAPWFAVPGLVLAVSAAALQITASAIGLADDSCWIQIFPPFAAMVTFVLGGLYWRRGFLWITAACLLPVANLFAVSVIWGRDLLNAQLTAAHIAGIALVLTVMEFAAVRWLLLKKNAQSASFAEAGRRLHYGSTALASLTLVLLGVHYLANPDLAQIPAMRFFTSGLLALSAGTYFRLAARRAENLRTNEGLWLESLWHVSLGLALWCGALLIPALRIPHAALYALALPAVACWFAAEWFVNFKQKTGENILTGTRFRSSASTFALLIVALYVFRLPFQMLLFPNIELGLNLYHTGATAMVLMGLILIRARGLGGAPWLVRIGGLALMVGIYFNVTWLPGLSPFESPMAGAWATVGIAHVLILLSFQQSPLRSLIQHLGKIGAEEWHENRSQWGQWLTVGVHIAVISGLLQDCQANSLAATPLLMALASMLIHQAVIGAPWARAYWVFAWFEILAALHLDFVLPNSVPALIPAKQVVWFLLALWLSGAVFWQRIKNHFDELLLTVAAVSLPMLCATHLYYHGPATGDGVLIAALFVLAALLTPLKREASSLRQAALPMLFAPLWLTYFGTRWFTGEGFYGFRALLAGATELIGSGVLISLIAERYAKNQLKADVAFDRLAHEVRDLCRRNGRVISREMLAMAFAGLSLLTCLHGDASRGSLGLMLVLALVWSGSCVAWFREGRIRDGVMPYTLSMLSAAGAWIVLRRLLFTHFNFWTYEYDIWLSLGASITFSAVKRLVKHERPGLGRTMTGTVWLIPALQCVWLLYNRMNADLTLLVIGIQSMLFAWHGGGKRDSAYNAVSMLGFVGFVCLLFWAKLDLRCVQAYTIPCGLGVLGLVWLFGKHMQPKLRNSVRLVTVLTMVGSCGYYALLDNTYPVGFHLTMIVLCLAVMALGPVLRVQVYLYFGFAGFVTDLMALVIKQFHAFDRSLQMVSVGGVLLLLGISVVGGAIFYKTHHEEIVAYFAKVRARLSSWE